jgi:hypothetical protein
LGALNRDRAAEFGVEAMVAGYDRVLRELIAAGCRGRRSRGFS